MRQWRSLWKRAFQSTLPVRGATILDTLTSDVRIVSIHAPRERSDLRNGATCQGSGWFQSTLPVRGATCDWLNTSAPPRFQSTLPVRGATSSGPSSCRQSVAFQSTLPVRGATGCGQPAKRRCDGFNPRSP